MQRQIPYRFQILVLVAITILAVFYAPACPALETGQVISEIDIKISGIRGDTSYWEEVARNMMAFNLQDDHSIEKIDQTIARLVESNLFESIHVADPIQTPLGIRLSFLLKPFGRIKDIIIQNAFPLFHREVLNVMNIYTGDVFSDQNLDEQVKRVTNLFKDEGYTDPEIKISAQKDEMDGNYTVFVRIKKNEFYSVGKVEFHGNHHVSSTALKFRISTWKSSLLFAGAGRFVRKTLDMDIKNFISYYRQKGFADVLVDAEILKDEPNKKKDVRFHIIEGPKYEISFQGNTIFRKFTLKKEAASLFKDGNKNDFGSKRTIRNLKRLYAENGYPDAVINEERLDDTPVNPSVRRLIFTIDAGRPYRVTQLTLSGNTALSESVIKSSILTGIRSKGFSGIYVPGILDEDILAVEALYARHGFLQTRVEENIRIEKPPSSDPKEPHSVEIDIKIEEGIQTLVDRIDVTESAALSEESALSSIRLKPGMAFDEERMEADKKTLQQKISESGYPHAAVKASAVFTPDRSGVDLSYKITHGPRVEIGQIIYAGNFKTRDETLSKEMTLHANGVLQLSKLIESRRNIRDMNAIDSARLRTIGLKNADEKVDIVVEVTEKKPYVVEAGIGYDTERHLYLNALAADRNFTGRNFDLQSEAEISQIGYKANLSFTDPRFLFSFLASTTRVFIEDREEFNKEFGTLTYGASQDFSRSFFDKKLMANLGFIYEHREQYLLTHRQQMETPEEEYLPRSILVTRPSLVLNTTDSYVRPRKGVLATANLDISKGIENHLDDFIKYRVEGRYYYTPFDSLTLAARARYGLIQPYGQNTRIPEDQLFYLGGAATVRGFAENLLRTDARGQAKGGKESVLYSLEARYDLGMNLELSAFYDIGTIAETQQSDIQETYRDSVGLGLRYMTPIGPIGFLYGHKLDPKPHESAGSFHFSMGYTF